MWEWLLFALVMAAAMGIVAAVAAFSIRRDDDEW